MAKAPFPKSKVRDKKEEADAQNTLKDTRSQVESALEATAKLRTEMEIDDDLIIGGERAWKKEDLAALTAEKRPVTSFNVAQGVVNFLCGYELDRRSDFRYFPRGTEDEFIGRAATALVKYQGDVSRNLAVESKQFRQGAIGGIGVSKICHSTDLCDDLIEGEVIEKDLARNAWLCDPFSRRSDRNDAQYQDELFWMTPDEAEGRWPQHATRFQGDNIGAWLKQCASTGEAKHLKEFYDKASRRIRVMEHWYRKPVKAVLVIDQAAPKGEEAVLRMGSEKEAEEFVKQQADQAGKQYQVVSTDEEISVIGPYGARAFTNQNDADAYLEKTREQVGRVAASRYEIMVKPTTVLRVRHLTGWELLDDVPSPYGVDWRFPYAVFIPYQDSDDYDSIKGLARDMRDPQRELNWHYATMLDKIVRGPKNPIFWSAADQQNMEKYKAQINRAGFMGTYTGAPPMVLQTPPIVQEELTLIQYCTQILMQITGINSELMGQTTQKTVSGRAIQARQAGGLVGVGFLMMNWLECRRYKAELKIRQIQKYYSIEKMMRILGQEDRVVIDLGLMGEKTVVNPPEVTYKKLKSMQELSFDIVADFQDASPTARSATVVQLMQAMAAGFPIPPQVVVDASDWPHKEEIRADLKKQGMGQPNEALAKVLGAGQGQSGSGPNGVNTSA